MSIQGRVFLIRSEESPATWIEYSGLTREDLRNLARKYGVRRGRNTEDTISNLKIAGRIIDLDEVLRLGKHYYFLSTEKSII